MPQNESQDDGMPAQPMHSRHALPATARMTENGPSPDAAARRERREAAIPVGAGQAAPPQPQARRLAAEVERLQNELRAAQERMRELQALVEIDSLTGICNRRGFERELSRALAFAARYGNAAALICIDLDGFKEVNDACGHGVGDSVLCAVAATLQRTVRGSDTVARIGGDEFALLLWNLDAAQAFAKARAVQAALAQMQVAHEGRMIAVGASAGVGALVPGDTLAQAMARADAAMYDDKRARKGGLRQEPG